MKQGENITKFIENLKSSIEEQTFVKATLGNYRGSDLHLQKLILRPIKTKKGLRISVIERARNRDTARTETDESIIELVGGLLGKDFFSGHLFTTESDFQLSVGKKGKARLNKGKPTFKTHPGYGHDRKKNQAVDQQSFFLKTLGITNDAGEVLPSRRDKWKQINKFVEVFKPLFDDAGLSKSDSLIVKDMGCGKGYLTFATYQFLSEGFESDVSVEGIDINPALTDLCNQLADTCGFEGLKFKTGSISETDFDKSDIVIALHACDTATDEAIYKGIASNASVIVVSPCCHRELRPQISAPPELSDTLKHGSLLESHSEFLTDALRALFLQEAGYETKVFDFIPTTHTPKNKLITAVKRRQKRNPEEFRDQIEALKSRYGIKSFTLENQLNSNSR